MLPEAPMSVDSLCPAPSPPGSPPCDAHSESSSDRSYSALDSPARTRSYVRSEFWFADGNVVLMTKDVVFKVHQGQLERHSDVFRNMFSMPQPIESPTYDGCYVVELHDAPSDVWYLLKALYDGLYFGKRIADDFVAVSAVLRLSTKYLIEHLRERCLHLLEQDWPTTLRGWDAREAAAMDEDDRYDPRRVIAHPILVINVACELGISSILPSAFYDLCRYGPSKIVTGARTSTRANAPNLAPSNVPVTPSKPKHTHISSPDLRRVLVGREEAQRVVAAFIESELSTRDVAPDCHNREREGGRICRESFYFIMLNLLRSVGGIACGRDCDPLYTLTQAVMMMSRNDFSDGTQLCSLKICAACKMDFAQVVTTARQTIWGQIPKWFGLLHLTTSKSSQAGL